MKIVHLVLGKANPERANGVNSVAHGLATAQTHAGADVEVWGITRDPAAPTPARSYALRLFPSSAHAWRLAPELVRALDLLPRNAVVHLHGGYHPEFHAAACRLAARGIEWVATPHGAFRTAVVRAGWIKKRAYLALFDGFVLRGARAVQVFSTREERELLRYAPRARTVVLPNGVDFLGFAPREGTPDAERPLVFGFCGRLASRTKGLDILLEGFARHVARGGAGDVRLIGAGADRPMLEWLARRLGVETRVHFLGELFGDRKLEQLRSMDVFVHASRHEGMPTAVLEAAAVGLPCLLSRETNLAEPFERERAGFVLEPNDAATLADVFARCEEFHADGTLAAHGRRARMLVARDFTWDAIGRRSLNELYGAGLPSSTRAA